MRIRTEDFIKEVSKNPDTKNCANSMHVSKVNGYYFIYSYNTVIAYRPINDPHWRITKDNYSVTTSKHTNYCKRYLLQSIEDFNFLLLS